MGSPSRTRLQSWRYFSCWGPSLPWLLQPQRLRLQQMLIPGTATDTVATDTVDTTGLMATMATMERGLLMPSQSPPLLLTLMLMLMAGTGRRRGLLMPSLLLMLWLTPLLMLMPGTATMATDTAATTGLMATMATTERGPLMPSLQLMP